MCIEYTIDIGTGKEFTGNSLTFTLNEVNRLYWVLAFRVRVASRHRFMSNVLYVHYSLHQFKHERGTVKDAPLEIFEMVHIQGAWTLGKKRLH